jgi:hypothetical protein
MSACLPGCPVTARLPGSLLLRKRHWPAEYRGGEILSYHEPSEADVAARPYLLATVSLQFTVPSAALPEAPGTAAALLSAGQQAVAIVASELNRIVGPLLGAGFGKTSPPAGTGR